MRVNPSSFSVLRRIARRRRLWALLSVDHVGYPVGWRGGPSQELEFTVSLHEHGRKAQLLRDVERRAARDLARHPRRSVACLVGFAQCGLVRTCGDSLWAPLGIFSEPSDLYIWDIAEADRLCANFKRTGGANREVDSVVVACVDYEMAESHPADQLGPLSLRKRKLWSNSTGTEGGEATASGPGDSGGGERASRPTIVSIVLMFDPDECLLESVAEAIVPLLQADLGLVKRVLGAWAVDGIPPDYRLGDDISVFEFGGLVPETADLEYCSLGAVVRSNWRRYLRRDACSGVGDGISLYMGRPTRRRAKRKLEVVLARLDLGVDDVFASFEYT